MRAQAGTNGFAVSDQSSEWRAFARHDAKKAAANGSIARRINIGNIRNDRTTHPSRQEMTHYTQNCDKMVRWRLPGCV
jgi:hypothetical protein